MNKYYVLLAGYVLASVASQLLTSTPIHLATLMDVPIWLPLSTLTLVPLVDVLRSFTQDQSEVKGFGFIRSAAMMLGTSLSASVLAVLFLGLHIQIFTAVLLAITIGGLCDVLVFRRMGKWYKSPVSRMVFSNAAATLVGSGIVFFVAFTDFVFTDNELAMPIDSVVVSWITQSLFIWSSSLVIALLLGNITKIKLFNKK